MSLYKKQNLIYHLIELRKRLINCALIILIVFLSLIFFSNNVHNLISAPLIKYLPKGANIIATDITATFFIPIKLVLIFSIFISFPVILYQVWSFIVPALYSYEKKILIPLIFLSTILFYLGIAFAYFIILPIAFKFFIQTTPDNVSIAVDIEKHLDFIITMFMSFGFAFEIPITIVLLCWTGITDIQYLKSKRSYILVITFIIGMILTPPDVISQILLAIPLYILFEIGLLLSFLYKTNV